MDVTRETLEEINRSLRNIEDKIDEFMSQLDSIEALLDERFDELLEKIEIKK